MTRTEVSDVDNFSHGDEKSTFKKFNCFWPFQTERNSNPRSFRTAPKTFFKALCVERCLENIITPTAGEAIIASPPSDMGTPLQVDHGKDPFVSILTRIKWS